MNFLFRVILLSCAVLLVSNVARAADSDDAIKERMQERLPEVTRLQAAGMVGENNKGFLEQRGAMSAEQTKTMNEENTDRRGLYESIASRLGYTAAEIGIQRAIQLRKLVPKGGWFQKPDNAWERNGAGS